MADKINLGLVPRILWLGLIGSGAVAAELQCESFNWSMKRGTIKCSTPSPLKYCNVLKVKLFPAEDWRMEKVKSKVKRTLVQALRLCTGTTAYRGSRGIAVLYRH